MLPRLVISTLVRCRPCVAPRFFLVPSERTYAIRVKEILRPTEPAVNGVSNSTVLPLNDATKKSSVSQAVLGILDSVDTSVTSSPASCEALFDAFCRLGDVAEEAKSALRDADSDPSRKFAELCAAVDKNCHRVSAGTIHRCMQAAVALGLPEDHRVVACLENELLWNLRKCKFRFLVLIAPFYAELQRSDLERRLHVEISASIQRRWVEVASLRDVLKLCAAGAADKYGVEFSSRLDDRAVEVAATAGPVDLQKMVCALAQKRRRPGPLLRALSYHLARHEMGLTPRQMADLMSALHALSFPDQPLLDRISTDFKLKLPEVTSLAVIRSVVTTVGLLRWRNTGLIDSLCEWLVANKAQVKPPEKIAVLHTLAVVNYLPSGVEDLLLNDFSSQGVLDSLSNEELLTFVWATVLLQKATSDSVKRLFDRLAQARPSGRTSASPGENLKLLNVVQFAKLNKISVPNGIDSQFSTGDGFQQRRSAESEAFSVAVMHALTHLVPKPKYLRETAQTGFGLRLDAEFVVNGDFEPVPLEKYAKSPTKLRRVALFCWNYPDYCLGSDRLTGYSAFVRRCCKQSGYVIFDVSHSEFDRKDKIVAKVQCLQKKMKALKGRVGALEDEVSSVAT